MFNLQVSCNFHERFFWAAADNDMVQEFPKLSNVVNLFGVRLFARLFEFDEEGPASWQPEHPVWVPGIALDD